MIEPGPETFECDQAVGGSRLPDFLIIGAAKAGTTWLVNCLRRHSGVFIPREEIHYWTRQSARIEPEHAWYRDLFGSAEPSQLIGENSNSYLVQPGAAELIHRWLPGVKLVTMLRNPVERAYSGYCMRLRYGEVTDDIWAHLDPDRQPDSEILSSGLYFERLRPYVSLFARDQLHFIVHDDLSTAADTVLSGLCEFLGTDFRPESMIVSDRINDKQGLWPSQRFHRLYERSSLVKSINDSIRGTWAHAAIKRALTRKVSYPALPPELRRRMAAFFADDVDRLSELLARDLRFWVTDGDERENRRPR